jgi:hypothetical protein
MEPNIALESWCESVFGSINEHKPDRTGKYAIAASRFLVSFWSNTMNDGVMIFNIFHALHEHTNWIKNNISDGWITVAYSKPERATTVVSIIIHCDNDTDAVLAKLTFGTQPVIEL